jgi:hypothetical protein
VRLQRLDAENEIVAIAIVPLADGEEGGLEGLDGELLEGDEAAIDVDAIDVDAIDAEVDASPTADADDVDA